MMPYRAIAGCSPSAAKAVMPRCISVGLLASRCVGIPTRSIVIRIKLWSRHRQTSPVQIDQSAGLIGSDHLAHAEVGLLYRLHRRQAFFLGVVIGVRTEHQPRLAVGLDLRNSAALEFLRVAATGARHFSLISEAGLDQQLPGVRLFLWIDPRHDRALIDGAEKGARVDVVRHHDLAGGDGYP